ncbi:MAG TPA: hypothetical protein VK623_02980 [Flavobacterium sp.]|nr:hypothetical protein [Flavobacterium sp.]
MKIKLSLLIIVLSTAFSAKGQVGIGTVVPDAQLDVRSSNQATPANNDGMLVPKVDAFPLANPTAAQQGMLVYLTTAASPLKPPGFYYWDNPTTGWIGITSTASSDKDWIEEGLTTAPDDINDDMYHIGNVGIGKNTANYPLDILSTNKDLGIYLNFDKNITTGGSNAGFFNYLSGTSDDFTMGIDNAVTISGNSAHFGVLNNMSGSGTGPHYGTQNELSAGTGLMTGVYNVIYPATSSSNHIGTKNYLYSPGSGGRYGTYTQISGIGLGNMFGSNTLIDNTGNGDHYGNYAALSGTGIGNHYGSYHDINGSGSNFGTYNTIISASTQFQYGIYTTMGGAGSGNKYGSYNYIDPAAGGVHYGVLSSATKAGSYAGYFLGNFAIGTTLANIYTMPPSRGTNNQVMVSDAVGGVTWQNPNTALNSYAWLTTGNSGTNPAGNFLGTTDGQALAFRTTNTERIRITAGGFVVVNNTVPFAGDVFSAYAAGTNYAVNGYASGSGSAGYFLSSAGTGNTIIGYHNGTAGSAGQFTTAGVSNANSTVDIYNATGSAPAVAIRTDLASAGADGIELDINGAAGKRGIDMYMDTATTGIGMAIFQDGTGRGLNIQHSSTTSTSNAIFASTAGPARVIGAQNALTTNTQMIGFFSQGSTGFAPGTYGNAAAVWGQSSGIRGGAFTGAGASANTTCLQGFYSGAAGNYDVVGVLGQAVPNAGFGYGVVGQGGFYGLYSLGNTGATGVKAFQIDHPLDPENKYLRHFSIESPEVLNMYRGNIILDNNGEATVVLPNYFSAIDIDFSYHLTPIGAAANLYVKEEIKDNHFKIAGGQPNQKISWQVIAERNDLYIQKNPESKAVEVEKKSYDKGLYLMPELYNQPEEKGIFHRYKADPSKVKNEEPVKEDKVVSTRTADKKLVAEEEAKPEKK